MDNISLFYSIFNLGHKSPVLDSLMVFGAVYLIFLTILLMVKLFFKAGIKEKKAVLLAIIGVLLALILEKFIHIFFYHPRPFITLGIIPLIKHANTASFPSGHTTIMAVIAFSYLFYKSKYAIYFLIFMFWVGLARVFVGVHYPLDILGGILTGFLAVSIIWIIKNLLIKKFLKI